ncbi:nucleotide pyrophosphohydrolase [archaeon]|nr:nucleotide pyrophosphohydrolase [archaeon]
MRIREFQTLMKELYYEKDKARGETKTLAWLKGEVKELTDAVMKNDEKAVGEEVADVVAWALSVANLKGVDVEKALLEKYPNLCGYCGKNPCVCEEGK